ncbi:putative phosphatase regulatory subunit-domain-containing protein [Pilaira anomala]|nr:putative phosphatase regulatory subunit-domain-containing protein [Pilaira anomala]
MGITTFSRNQRSWGGRSDFSRPSYGSSTVTVVEEEEKEPKKKEEEISHITQPRFSVFAAMEPMRRKSNSNKFELHLSSSTKKKKKKSVAFDPIFLEKVCLFREEQSPCELKEAHDNTNTKFRIICPNWPVFTTSTTTSLNQNILLNKKSFFITDDNKFIKGKILIRNLALDKSVSVKYTLDAWTTVNDVDAVFFGPNPKNVAFDIYEFSMNLGHGQLADRGEIRGKLEFTIRFTAGEDDYWDNNQGLNYKIRVLCDPLNDPWAKEKEIEKQETEHLDNEEEEDDDDDYSEAEEDDMDEQENQEKHSSFTNALKGYKHAKPFHLNKRQPWLGTRYDFSQSLHYPKLSTTTSTPTTTTSTKNPSLPIYTAPSSTTTSSSAPPSPRTSPTLASALPPRPAFHNHSRSTSSILPTISSTSSPLDMNSPYYLDLVNKYCFYHSDSSIN